MKRKKKPESHKPKFPDAFDDGPDARKQFHTAFPPTGNNPWPKDIAKPHPTRKLVMTNDPSITAWGWAVVDPTNSKIISVGAIKTVPQAGKLRIRKGDDTVRRVHEINKTLLQVLKDHEIALIVSELPHGSQSAQAAQMIGIVTGIMQTIGDCMNIPVEWFSEGDAKVATTGRRSVEKDDMVRVVCKLFDSAEWKKTKWENQAIADSLAVYYVAEQESQILKMLTNQ